MKVLNGAILTSCAHLSRIVMGLVLIKIIAFYLGAEGMGQIGQFMSMATMVYMVAGGGITNAVIKYVAEYASRPKQLLRFLSTATTYSVVFSCALLCVGVIFSKVIAVAVFKNSGMYWIIIALAFAQLLFAFVNLVVGVSNGLMQTAVYSKIQIIGSALALPLIWVLIVQFGLAGAALSVLVVYAITCIPAFYFYVNSTFFGKVKLRKLEMFEFKRISAFTVMMLTSALTFPVVEMMIRHVLIESSGYAAAGIWQGAVKLSSAYLGFFTVFLAYYFMPAISRLDNKGEIGRITIKFLISMMLLFSIGASVFYVGRDFLIPLILASSFDALGDVIVYQLLGDLFRVSSYVIGFVAVAKAATKIYIAAELLQNGLFLLSAMLMLHLYGDIRAVMVSYAVTYIIYFIVSAIFFGFYLKAAPLHRKENASSC
ncbi:O-antigen translocase [Pseudomonas deceptionensis]|uniref:Polysaccharide transporter, PST family n=1 Tax=Pseudomonas deceptionensis TaxID=882211 RepID=A0A0J6JB32_PSEDM|nr:O-antigen translocase [Pseudomonas deceptionensis]KMM81062.1 lipopolysaccharide biosynthesis protein [Pseudomonas deceptionensis]SEE85084.1 polysaccharide transporter, PST family [Pseudomonas deceptionensis]